MNSGEFERATAMIEQTLAADGRFAEGRQVELANWLVMGANWRLIGRLLPSHTNSLFTGGWLNSLVHGRLADAEGGMLPWLSYSAIDFIEGVVRADWRVFEWGSGTSTAWWGSRVEHIHAIEHERQYYDQVAAFGLANLTLRLCEASEDYVGAIDSAAGGPFDAIIIDGEAPTHLKSGGILIFDDSDRAAHRDSLVHLRGGGLKRIEFFGLGPSFLYRKCTSVYLSDDAILTPATLPSEKRSCLGPTISRAMGE
ncbi:MAG: hypothetical protein VCD31_03405 [Alphaproteobacteria bacterium]